LKEENIKLKIKHGGPIVADKIQKQCLWIQQNLIVVELEEFHMIMSHEDMRWKGEYSGRGEHQMCNSMNIFNV
jgi:hypothetical protein